MEPEIAATPVSASAPVLEARLVHAEPGRRVVEVSAWQQGRCLGRCLGEAEEAETAEDRARQRLQRWLGEPRRPAPRPAQATPPPRPQPVSAATAPTATATEPEPVPEPEPSPPPAEESLPDPDDWSEELAELELQLQRLGWDRDREATYLQRAFGHPSRSRLTAFADLAAYLRRLRSLAAGCLPETAPVPLRRRDLLHQSDQLLQQLGWDAARGRTLLEQQFQLASRQQLSDEQLLQFNMLLEEQLMPGGSAAAAAANPG